MRVAKYAAPSAALLLIAGCAGLGGSKNARSQAVSTPQERSAKALDNARESQKRASDQAERAAEARQDVQKKQQELQAAQEKARQEQAKAEQMQQQARQETAQASQTAQEAQQQATNALAQRNQAMQQGVMTLRGNVSQASGQQIVVKSPDGKPMTFRVTNETDVRIDGRRANAGEIQPGEDALVAYEVSGTQPTARTVQVVTGNSALQGGGPSSSRTEPSSTGPSTSGGTSTSTGTSTYPSDTGTGR